MTNGAVLQPKITITVTLDVLTGAIHCDLSQPLPLEAVAVAFASVTTSLAKTQNDLRLSAAAKSPAVKP